MSRALTVVLLLLGLLASAAPLADVMPGEGIAVR